jgi:hypothetical protein
VKRAADEVAVPVEAFQSPEYAKGLLVNQQTRLPLGGRRELTPEEARSIEEHKARMLPHLFPSWADKPEVEMYSPTTSAVGGAVAGGLVGLLPTLATSALAGGALQSIQNEIAKNQAGKATFGQNLAMNVALPALGLAPMLFGAGLGGLLGYKKRESSNQTIEDIKRRFPEGATRRDVMSDPLYERIQGEAMGKVIAQSLLEAGMRSRMERDRRSPYYLYS